MRVALLDYFRRFSVIFAIPYFASDAPLYLRRAMPLIELPCHLFATPLFLRRRSHTVGIVAVTVFSLFICAALFSRCAAMLFSADARCLPPLSRFIYYLSRHFHVSDMPMLPAAAVFAAAAFIYF